MEEHKDSAQRALTVHTNLKMDKLGSDAAACAQEMHQRRQRREPQTALEPTLRNSYKSQQSFKGKHLGLSSTQSSSDKVILRRPEYIKRPNDVLPKNSSCDPLTQASARGHQLPGHGRKDMKGRGQGMQESVTFQVKMDEFPELSGIFMGQGDHPRFQRHCWELRTPTLEENSESAWKVNRNVSSSYCDSTKIPVLSSSSENAMDHESSSTSIPSSWANIASQPPKKPVSKDITKPAQVDEVVPQQQEANTGKKKRNKKKKKAKGTDDDTEIESEKHVLNQDPPKFEDEDEFPGLTPISTKSRTTNQSDNEGQSHRPQSAKAPFIDASKAQKAEKVSGKKSKVPVQLDIGNMLAVLEKKQSQKAKQDTKPLTLSVGGGLPVVPKQQPAQKKSWMQDKIAHNPLDSTSPLVKKGKQREVPKTKKPTALKKIILKEREERKQRRLLVEKGLLPECESIKSEDTAEDENSKTVAADSTLSPVEDLPAEHPAEINGHTNEEKGDNEETPQELTASTLVPSFDQPKIHSRKFREYCTQMLSKDVDECVTTLLKELVRFQDRLYQKDPMKARMKRRIVMGLREVLKHLKLRKVKCVIISPNCERIQSKGGLDEALHTVIDTCREQEVPFVFALSRKALGRCVNKAVPVSLVGIFNFDGAQDIYHKMIDLSSEARKAYEEMLLSLEQTESEWEVDKELLLNTDQIDTSDPAPAKEPEYIKLWKKLLEKESSQTFLNFEEELSSMCLDSECSEHSVDGGMS